MTGTLLHAGETQTLDDGYLSKLRTEAARNHPSAVAGIYEAQAAAHEARAVRLWSDSMLGAGFMGAEQMMRTDDGDVMIGLEQALPKPGMFAAERAKMDAMQRAEKENASASAIAAGAQAARAEFARITHVNPNVRAMREMAADANADARIAARERLPEVAVGAAIHTSKSCQEYRTARKS